MVSKREYVIKELMVEDFIERETDTICLEETEDSGRSILQIHMKSSENLSIQNIDKKNTQLHFFQTGKSKSLFKRVDHIIFEHLENDRWTYEKVCFSLPETMPVARRPHSGESLVKPEEEWSGKNFGLNFGTRIRFSHRPLHMERDAKGILKGNYDISATKERGSRNLWQIRTKVFKEHIPGCSLIRIMRRNSWIRH